MAQEISAGPLAHQFSLTLEPGWRKEAMGPFYGYQRIDTQTQWSVNPFVSCVRDPSIESMEFDFLYPLLTYDITGKEYRIQLGQLLSIAGGQNQEGVTSTRHTIFPFFFSQRSADTNQNYTAVIPFYGYLRNRIYRDETEFYLYPLYVTSRKKDVHTRNFFLPFFHLRQGNALSGWQFWPLVGYETKELTYRTNSVDEIEPVGGHRKTFLLWPIYFNQRTGLGTTNEGAAFGVLPFYTAQRSPQRESTTYLWPLITYTVDRERGYREWDVPWPAVSFARGEGKTMNRVLPFYSHAYNTNMESDALLWPLYVHKRLKTDSLQRDRTRIAYFLYSDVIEKLPGTNLPMRRTDLWPLFSARRDHNGDQRLQILSLFETVLAQRKSLERNYSPLWSVWRAEKNGKTGARSVSVLWNTLRWEKSAEAEKASFLFGLLQYQKSSRGMRWRIFYVPLGGSVTPAARPIRS